MTPYPASPLDRARANIPAYASAHAARENLTAIDLAEYDADAAFEALRALLHERAAAGPITAQDLNEDILPIAMRNITGDLLRTVITRCIAETRDLPAQLDAQHRDDLLNDLNDQLATVVEAASELAPLSDFATEADVLRSRRLDDYDEFRRLADQHRLIRDAQFQIAGTHYSQTEPLAGEARYLKELELQFPKDDPAAWLKDRASSNWMRPAVAPWGSEDRLTVTNTSTPDFFAWALESGAQLWVPTIAQHAAESRRLAQRAALHTVDTDV